MYVDVAWDTNWVEAYMDQLQNTVRCSIILEFQIILIRYLPVYELLYSIPGDKERRFPAPS